jgi:hypothetical protein
MDSRLPHPSSDPQRAGFTTRRRRLPYPSAEKRIEGVGNFSIQPKTALGFKLNIKQENGCNMTGK